MKQPRPANAAYDKVHLLLYSNEVEPFARNAENYCDAALGVGFDSARHYTERELRDTAFWQENSGILEQGRGAGYWLWKPYILLETLQNIDDDDVLVYNDVGRYSPGSFDPFPRFPHTLLQLAALSRKRYIKGFITEFMHQAHHTKADCFQLMDAMNDTMLHAPQISAGPMILMRSPEVFAFLEAWLNYSKDPRILTDIPDEVAPTHWDFEEHRHDQAIASILAHRMRAHYVDMSRDGIQHTKRKAQQLYPGVPRLPTHVGYLSELVRLALPDGFWDTPQPDLAQCATILANLEQDNPIPFKPRNVSNKINTARYVAGFADRQSEVDLDQLRAMLTGDPIAVLYLHWFKKLEVDQADFWQSVVANVQGKAQDELDLDVDDINPQVLRLTVRSFFETLARFADIQQSVNRQMVRSSFSDDLRTIWKERYKNFKSQRSCDALDQVVAMSAYLENVDARAGGKLRRRALVDDIHACAAAFLDLPPTDDVTPPFGPV